jgi:hypothetical protein
MPDFPPDDVLLTWDGPDVVVSLVERIRPRESDFTALNEPERTILSIFGLYSHVCNGGFESWLNYASTEMILETPGALRRIGDEWVLLLVECILEEFPKGIPFDDAERQDEIVQMPDIFFKRLLAFGFAFNDIEKTMSERLEAYAKANIRRIPIPR